MQVRASGSVVFSFFNKPFSLTSDCLAMVLMAGKSTLSPEVSDALPNALEKPKDRFMCTPDRTHNRTRSPCLKI